MDAKTREFLDSLKADGFPVGELETAINSSPALEAKAKAKVGGSVLRQETFTKMMQDANKAKTEYETKIKQLAAGNDTVNSLADDDPTKKALQEVIKAQIDLLVEEGYDRAELEKLSYNALNLAVTKKEETKATEEKKEEKEVPQDMSKYIDADTLERQSEMGVYTSVATNALVQSALEEARDLGIKIPKDKILSLTAELKRKVDAGENVVNVIDQHFDLPTARLAYDKATRDKEIADARAAGKAEGLKESGVPSRRVTKLGGEHNIFDNDNIRRNAAREKVVADTAEKKLADIPKNKYGDAEVYRVRRTPEERMERQMAFMDKVVDGETSATAE